MIILALDPGTEKTAYVALDGDKILYRDIRENVVVVEVVRAASVSPADYALAIEMIAPYGKAVGSTVFETCVWVGRFFQAWTDRDQTEPMLVFRRDAYEALTGSRRMVGGDEAIRKALIDRWGGPSALVGEQCRCKNGMTTDTVIPRPCRDCDGNGWRVAPGPLYGLRRDEWAALGVAVAAQRRLAAQSEGK